MKSGHSYYGGSNCLNSSVTGGNSIVQMMLKQQRGKAEGGYEEEYRFNQAFNNTQNLGASLGSNADCELTGRLSDVLNNT